MKPAVFLDRDNTLIANDGDLGDPDAVRLLDGVPAGLKALREAGYQLVVITNQGGVARGVFTEADVDSVHQRIATLIDDETDGHRVIDRFYYCPYHPSAKLPEYERDHPWRKPHPGMLLQAAQDLDIDLARSWMIGDQERDMVAGRSAGCRTVLLSTDAHEEVSCTDRAPSFSEAVDCVLRETPPRGHTPNGGPPEMHRWGETSTGPAATPPSAGDAPSGRTEVVALRRSMLELAEEVRTERMRRAEFTPLKMLAVATQLMVLLTALLGLLHVDTIEVFAKWMVGAILLQLVTITIVLTDARG